MFLKALNHLQADAYSSDKKYVLNKKFYIYIHKWLLGEKQMVIESASELQELLSKHSQDELILIPILCDEKSHVVNNTLCMLFLKIIGKPDHYILPYDHNDCVQLSKDTLQLLNPIKKYVLDKKHLLNIYPFENVTDVMLLYYLKNNSMIEKPFFHCTHSKLHLMNKFPNIKNLNKAVPILKLQEDCVELAKDIEELLLGCKEYENTGCFSKLNDDKIGCLREIESQGLYVDPVLMNQYFPNSKGYVKDNLIYTEYYLNTTTGRPSNRFGNINFAALNKSTGERQAFVSRFGSEGILVMHDYESYHLRLIAEMIGFTFPTGISVHEYLGRQYFNKETLTEDEYKDSKAMSFQMLYGGIDKNVAAEIPFFHQVQDFINTMWNKYRTDGYVETGIFKQKFFRKNFEDMNANKLFNFMQQNIETEHNIIVIKKIQDLLRNHHTKLVLYLYDAFLFDTKLTDGKDLVLKIKEIMEDGGKYPVKTYFGSNFHDMYAVKL